MRFVLGMLQMAGVAMTLPIMAATGVSAWTVGAALLTTLCTTISLLLFRGSAGRS